MGDRTPTADEIAVARQYLQLLTSETLRDYLRSTDELLAQVPTEFTQKLRQVEDAESFIYVCSSGEVDPAERMLDSSWEVSNQRKQGFAGPQCPIGAFTALSAQLIHAIDRDGHTALHAAAAMNHLGICQLLISRGAKVNSQVWALDSAAPSRSIHAVDVFAGF